MGSIEDPSTWPQYSEADQELENMIKNKIAPKFTKQNKISAIAPTRKIWAAQYGKDAEAIMEGAKNDVSLEEISIPLKDDTETRAIVFRPKRAPAKGSPIVIMVHGGGFCFGTAEMEAPACIGVTQKYGCISVSLDYRLAPEHKFPTAFEDVWDSLKWLAENGASLGADLSRGFILGGTSAGGQIAASLEHRARDENLSPPLTGVYLNVPGLLDPEAVPEKYRDLYQSRKQNGDGMLLSTETVAMYDEALQPIKGSYTWSPFIWPTGHSGLPPTYFQICGGDILRDEALVYERVLRQDHGIKTKVDIYPGLPHVFWVNYPQHSVSRKFLEDTINGLGWLLEQKN